MAYAVQSTRVDILATVGCNVLVGSLYALFAFAHISGLRSGNWTAMMPLVMQETLLMLFFVTRRPSFSTSARPFDWVVAVVGTFLPMLLRPANPLGVFDWLGRPLSMTGFALAILGLLFLGRSIGIVAANRGVKTGGAYRLVRHPMYAAYLITYIGYVASYPTLRNVLLVVTIVITLNTRAVAEERLLQLDPAYREYLSNVRWRFVPYMY